VVLGLRGRRGSLRQPVRTALVAVTFFVIIGWSTAVAHAQVARPIPRGVSVCTPAPAGMIAWWRFEGTGNTDSAGAHGLTFTNGATISAGHVGSALTLDGVNQSATTPDTAEWDFGTNSFSIDFWFKLDVVPTATDVALMAHSTGTGAVNKWIVFYDGETDAAERRMKITFGGSLNTSFVSNPVVVTAGAYHHFALTRNAAFASGGFTDQWTFYFDGVNVGQLSFMADQVVPDATGPSSSGPRTVSSSWTVSSTRSRC